MLSFIGFLPAIFAFHYASKYSVQKAFFRVYLPVLLCLPEYYRVVTPGLPDPTFSQGVGVALLIVAMQKGSLSKFRFSHLDIVVAIYAVTVANSEYQASGYSDAQNLMFAMLFSVLFPYVMAKTFIEPDGMRFEFAKTIVLCLSAVSIINVYETRFGMNPFQLVLERFFPGQGAGWIVTFRFGMARTAGPYGHALVAGIMMLVGYRLQRWLQFCDAWPKKIKQLPWLPLTAAQTFTLILTGGFFITFAKGSWLAGFIAGFLVFVGKMKNRVLALLTVLGFLIFVGIPAASAFIDYASVGRKNAKDDNQETACYRYELIIGYIDIAKEKAMWGWGLTKWPQLPGMPSIDNHYLLLFLMHGQIAFTCFLYVLMGTMFRLLVYAARSPPPFRTGASLPFTLASIFLGYVVAIATVYMGGATIPMLFMLAGWSESFMLSRGQDYDPQGGNAQATPTDNRLFKFKRVV